MSQRQFITVYLAIKNNEKGLFTANSMIRNTPLLTPVLKTVSSQPNAISLFVSSSFDFKNFDILEAIFLSQPLSTKI